MEAITAIGCKECGSFEDLHGCINCHKPVCPNHRDGFGEAGQYYCSMSCTVEHAFPTPKKRITGAQLARWFANGLLAASIVYFVSTVIYVVNLYFHR